MKLIKYFLIGSAINIGLFLLLYFLPFNPIQLLIAKLITIFVFLFGISAKMANTGIPIIAATYKNITLKIAIFQTFYEFLTIIALTIPLYLNDWKKMIEKTLIVIVIMLGYYILLYGLAITLFLKSYRSLLTDFLSFNTESFMIIVFGLIWFFVNKKKILKIIYELRKH